MEHQSGQALSTKNRAPFKLIYYEAYLLKEDALSREQYLKTSMGKRVLKKQLLNFIKTLKSDKITAVPDFGACPDGVNEVNHNIGAG